MAKFRLRGSVEAISVREAVKYASQDWGRLPERIRRAYEYGDLLFTGGGIDLPGKAFASADDWVLWAPTGPIHACEGDAFHGFYEPVTA